MKLADRLPWLCLIFGGVLLLNSDGGTPFSPTAGPRHIVILRESERDTPAFGNMVGLLRAGAPAKYLAEKGHRFTLFDVNDEDENGRPVKLVEELKTFAVPPPALFVLPLDGGNPLYKATLPKPPSADAVVDAVKGTGG